MGYPHGVNLLSNTSVFALGVLLAPITWIFGPIATLNVAMTMSPILSALAMFMLLRRWVSWAPAAFFGGLLYGFSPFILTSLSNSWLTLGMGVVPPLVIICLDNLLLRQRGRPVVDGLLLGLLAVLQFFLSDEVLLITAIGVAIGVVLVGVCAAWRHPRALRLHLRYAMVGLASGVVTTVILLGYPAWYALAGPANLSGSIWGPHSIVSYSGNSWHNYLFPATIPPTASDLFHRFGGYQGPDLSPQFFGIGIVVVLIAGCIVWRRDRRLWLFGLLGLISVPLSIGLEDHRWTIWRLFVRLPLMENIEPYRFVLITYLTASIMLGLIVDHSYRSVNRQRRSPHAVEGGQRFRSVQGSPRWLGSAVGMTVAAIALVAPVAYLAQTVPMTTRSVELPTWFRTVAPHLGGRQVVLTFPDSDTLLSELTWQAVDGMSYSMVGLGGPGGATARAGREREGQAVISSVSSAYPNAPILTTGDIAEVRQALSGWGVTMVVLPDQPDLPVYERVPSVIATAALMTAATGHPPIQQADAWVWNQVNRGPAPSLPTGDRLSHCIEAGAPSGVSVVPFVAACVLVAPRTP